MIESIMLKFGRDDSNFELPITPLTVFVGANHSGKSHILREIKSICCDGDSQTGRKFVRSWKYVPPRDEQIPGLIDTVLAARGPNAHPTPGDPQEHLRRVIREGSSKPLANISHEVLLHCNLVIDAQQRLTLCRDEDPRASTIGGGARTLKRLFYSGKQLAKLTSIVRAELDRHLVIDPTDNGLFKLRLHDSPPDENLRESISIQAREAHERGELVNSMSDGMKSFIGILAAATSGEPRILFVDEPEAHLQTSLAFALGRHLPTVLTPESRLFAATHSGAFLLGCVQSGLPVTIVRLTFGTQKKASATVLAHSRLAALMTDPMLRSVAFLDALFHAGVVVSEGDSDTAFYREINERLMEMSDKRRIRDGVFMNARSKQTIPSIVGPLRELGIPAASVFDLELLLDHSQDWQRVLKACNAGNLMREVEVVQWQLVKTTIEDIGTKDVLNAERLAQELSGQRTDAIKNLARELKAYGLTKLPEGVADDVRDLISRLRLYGIFLVTVGEVENWLIDLGARDGGKRTWLPRIFERLGKTGAPDYVRPQSGDVWDFVGQINDWIADDSRRGMPILPANPEQTIPPSGD